MRSPESLVLVDRYSWWKLLMVPDCPLTTTERLVAFVASTYANKDGGSVHPGVTNLAYATGLHERTVQRALDTLEDSGYLACIARANGQRSRANRYALAANLDRYSSNLGSPSADSLVVPVARKRAPSRKDHLPHPSGAAPAPGVMYLSPLSDSRDANHLTPAPSYPTREPTS